ncbi:MAG TPA: lamin tail domain-containing protein, partial [Anaerolineaceae bacterium]
MKQNMPRLFVFALILAFIVSFLPAHAHPAYAVSSSIVISQVYGGGGNAGATYKNDFIELYNLSAFPVNVTGWSVQYGSSTGTTWTNRTNLSGSIQPGHYYLIQEAAGTGGTVYLPTPDATGNIAMAAGAGKVALANNTTALAGACPTGSNIIDFVGYGNTTGSTANCSETAPAPTLSNTTADLRNGDGSVDTDNNASDFTVGAPNPRNSLFPFAAVGLATPAMIGSGDTTLLTVTVSPAPDSTGITVACNLSSIGGSATQTLYDTGTNGDAVAGDNIFSFSTIATGDGTINLPCTFADTQGRVGTTPITLVIPTILPIGTVNGVISDSTDAPSHNAAYLNQTVIIEGVIFEKTLAPTSSGGTNYGFFIQNNATTADGDVNTSDGLFVYMGSASKIGSYTPTVGDEVILSGKVTEYYNMTELGSPFTVSVVRSGVNLDSEVPAFVANPPSNLADANRYWERRQGMRGQVPANSIVLNGRNVFSPADAEIWLAGPDSAVALRADPYTRRAFRDAHPLDDNYNPLNWDGNGYRILMGSQGIKFTEGNVQALLVPARTFDTVTNAPVGGVNYSYSKYRLEVTTQPVLSDGPDPAANNPPEAFDRSINYSIVDYNLENLYDFRNNPFSGCDDTGDSGCPLVAPFLAAITPPYDYVPASDAAYQARLNDIALQIVDDLHSPDILMMQEVENQDICTVTGGALTCGTTDNTDGKPDVLQELALKIASLGGPAYDAAFDRNSSDLRGIAPAFLYRTDRVQLLPPDGDPVLGSSPAIGSYTSVPYDSDVSNPKTLNAVYTGTGACETSWVFPRAPDIGLFRIYTTSIGVGSYRDV